MRLRSKHPVAEIVTVAVRPRQRHRPQPTGAEWTLSIRRKITYLPNTAGASMPRMRSVRCDWRAKRALDLVQAGGAPRGEDALSEICAKRSRRPRCWPMRVQADGFIASTSVSEAKSWKDAGAVAIMPARRADRVRARYPRTGDDPA